MNIYKKNTVRKVKGKNIKRKLKELNNTSLTPREFFPNYLS